MQIRLREAQRLGFNSAIIPKLPNKEISSRNNTQIKFICDASKRKINKYTPGTNIKIISKNRSKYFAIKKVFLIIS